MYPGAYTFKFNQISNLYNGNYAIIDNISLNFLSPLPNSFVDVFNKSNLNKFMIKLI